MDCWGTGAQRPRGPGGPRGWGGWTTEAGAWMGLTRYRTAAGVADPGHAAANAGKTNNRGAKGSADCAMEKTAGKRRTNPARGALETAAIGEPA
eukprot:2965664-Lingulodinium_polyedra.AAC.1